MDILRKTTNNILHKTTKDSSSQSSRRGLSRLYRVPVPHQLWGQPQPETETNWAELFSDLTYVGVAFQEGALIADSLTTKHFDEGFAIFLVTFMLLFDVWRVRMQLSARFHARDIAHKLVDIIQMLFVAAAALHIGTLDKFKDLSTFYSTGFAVALSGLSIISLMRGLELMIWSPLQAARETGEQMVRHELIPLALKLFSVYASVPSSGFEWYVPVVVWAAVIVVVRVDLFVRIYFPNKIPKFYQGRGRENSVPMNMEHSIHRHGEWTMLMLGEGILQLIVVPVKPIGEFYATFIVGYMLMALLQLLHYSIEPNHPDGHAMRRSVRRVWFWMNFESLYSASLVCVGVGLKLVLKYATYDLEKSQRYRSLLAGACSASIMLVWACRLCHAGFSEAFLVHTGHMRFKKFLVWVVKLGLSGACLALAFAEVNNWIVEAGCAVCVLLSFFAQLYDSQKFGDSLRKHTPHQHVSDIEENAEGEVMKEDDSDRSADDEALAALAGETLFDPDGNGENDAVDEEVDLELLDSKIKNYQTQIKELEKLRRRHGTSQTSDDR